MIYLCAVPEELSSCQHHFPHIAHAACHVARNGQFRIAPALSCSKEDLLLLTAETNCSFPHPSNLCNSLKKVCANSGCRGIIADLPLPKTTESLHFLSMLYQDFSSAGYNFFVPEEFAAQFSDATAILCTAMSGGFFAKRLEEAVNRFGSNHLALDLQRLIMDFPIPAPTGLGTPLSPSQFKEILIQQRPAVFFSRELCAKYFTYRKQEHLHLVLFDDTATLLEKIRIGRNLGISQFFLSYPEISDIIVPLSLAANKEKNPVT